MGHSQAAKAATRQRILQVAARRLREDGLEGVGLAEIASETGITTGAIYRHFRSRQEMLSEVLDEAARSLDVWAAASPDLPTALRNYLSAAHRDTPGLGCPLVALANDTARSDTATRESYTHHLQRILGFIEGLLAAQGHENARATALLLFCACIGAMGMARAVDDRVLAQQILDDVCAGLTALDNTAIESAGVTG